MKYIILGLMFIASFAQAKFVETDWQVAGDSSATLDTESGLEWLDLSLTAGMSIADVQSQTGVGGQFEGWRLPSYVEIDYLINEGVFEGVIPGNGSFSSGLYSSGVNYFYQLHGYTRNSDRSYGMYIDANGELRIYGVMDSDWIRINHDHPTYPDNGPYTYSHFMHAVWLVSDGGVTLSSTINSQINDPIYWANGGTLQPSDVPSPIVPMIGLLFAGFGLWQRHK